MADGKIVKEQDEYVADGKIVKEQDEYVAELWVWCEQCYGLTLHENNSCKQCGNYTPPPHKPSTTWSPTK